MICDAPGTRCLPTLWFLWLLVPACLLDVLGTLLLGLGRPRIAAGFAIWLPALLLRLA